MQRVGKFHECDHLSPDTGHWMDAIKDTIVIEVSSCGLTFCLLSYLENDNSVLDNISKSRLLHHISLLKLWLVIRAV